MLLGCVTTGLAGSLSDPLISLSYLTETFFAGLKAYVTQWVAQDTQKLYDAAAARAEQTSGPEDSWSSSFGFVPGETEYSGTVTLSAGSGLIWTDGAGAVSSGVLVDATAGMELAAGKALTAGHRYLAAEDTVVVTSSQSARWMAEGTWFLGTGGTVVIPFPFTDVPEGAWYYDDVRYVWEKKLVTGVSDTEFNPKGTMERGMATTLLYRLSEEPAVSYSPVFSDVPDGQWYTDGIIWCAQVGIVDGVGGGLFAPGQLLTRQQIATILYNYAVKTGRTAGERGNLDAFPDGEAVASWAKTGMSWAVGAGIFGGNDEGKLIPELEADRGQMAAIIHHYMNWLEAQA